MSKHSEESKDASLIFKGGDEIKSQWVGIDHQSWMKATYLNRCLYAADKLAQQLLLASRESLLLSGGGERSVIGVEIRHDVDGTVECRR